MLAPPHIYLPPDMLNEILAYLSIKDLERLRKSCKFFYCSLLDYLTSRLKKEAVIQIVAQWQYTLFLKKNGTVWACGKNFEGQLGRDPLNDWDCIKEATQVVLPDKVKKIISVNEHTFFLTNNGRVFACGLGSDWFANETGWLGRDMQSQKGRVLKPEPILTSKKVKDLIASNTSTFLILEDNSILACGMNNYGQLAVGDSNPYHATPTPIVLKNVKQVIPESKNTFFILNDNSVWGCGENFQGCLGVGDKIPHLQPECIISTGQLKEIVHSGWRTFFILANGQVLFSGSNRNFIDRIPYLGNKESYADLTAISLPGKVKQIVDGISYMLVLLEDGNAYASGLDHALGLIDYSHQSHRLEPISRLSHIKKICIGVHNIFFILEDGSVWACGLNIQGELGLGNKRPHVTPTHVDLPNKVKEVITAHEHTLFLLEDDTVWACGSNSHNQLGYYSYYGDRLFTTPQPIDKLNQWHSYLNNIMTKNGHQDEEKEKCILLQK